MMKNSFIILLTITFLMSGCSHRKNIDVLDKIAGYEYDNTIICKVFDKKIKYLYYDNINNFIVTEDNDVYIFNLYQLYSGDQNCKKIDGKFDDIVHIDIEYQDNGLYLGKYIGQTAYYNSNFQIVSVDSINYKIVRRNIYKYQQEELKAYLRAIKEKGYTKFRMTNNNTAFGIKNNNIYMFRIAKNDGKTIIDKEHIVYSVPSDEIILDFYFSTDAKIENRDGKIFWRDTGNIEVDISRKYILTDKSYYRPKLINEECKKYLDVKCQYEWQKDDELSEIRNDILFRDSEYLILSNGRVFYNSEFTP